VVVITFDCITKNFPGVAALSDVSFDVQSGECHALLGENGAGKSTLGKILAGMYRPDGGRILIDGRTANFHSPLHAARAGIAIVHQELVFCPNLSVAENLCLHDLPRKGLFLDRGRLRRQAAAILAEIGLAVDVARALSSLSIAQEQLVQIAAAVGLGAKIIVFDEPTSSLGRGEVDRLFALIRRLRQSGVTIIYVSHRLEEVFELCQTVTVLRDGRHIATRPITALDHDELVRLMVGRNVETAAPSSQESHARPVRLQVCKFSSRGRFSNISFELRSGEIVGLAGLVGAGRSEVLEALFGLDRFADGDVVIDGKPIRVRSSRQAIRLGMTLIPEDRKRQGLVLQMNVRENVTLPIIDRFRRALGWVDRQTETSVADRFRRDLSIRAASGESAISSLSGGNQQKIVFARGLAADCRILLVDEPTRGVDVAAKREIHELLRQLANRGTAVLLVSSDLPELLALAHRVLVLRQGRIVAELAQEQATPDVVLRAMAGIVSPSVSTGD
jgi:ABC-type sugar transport system ATPase subunit